MQLLPVHPTVVFVNFSVILGLAYNSTTSVVFLLVEVLILNRLLQVKMIERTRARKCVLQAWVRMGRRSARKLPGLGLLVHWWALRTAPARGHDDLGLELSRPRATSHSS